MKLEIKNFNLSSLLFSAFPMLILFTAFVLGAVAIFIVPNPIWIPVTFIGKLIGLILYSLVVFIITMAYFMFVFFIYNFFVDIVGLKGLTVKIEEVQ